MPYGDTWAGRVAVAGSVGETAAGVAGEHRHVPSTVKHKNAELRKLV